MIFKPAKSFYFFLLTLLFLLLPISLIWAQRAIPPKPTKQTSVYDQAGMLNEQETKQLEQKLINYADSTSTQIVVIIINSLQGEYIGTYAAEWAHKWGIGQSKKDNGVLLMASEKDRSFWITTGYGLEPFLTDAQSSMIYNRIIKPEFQKENYYKGLDEGTTAIMQILSGEFQTNPANHENGFPLAVFIFLFFILFFIVLFIIIFIKRGGGSGDGSGGKKHRDNSWLFDAIILSNLGRTGGGGFFGSGRSSGGFGGGGGFSGGFGGGGFGGGGAGGKW